MVTRAQSRRQDYAFKKDDRYNLSMLNVAIIEHINKCEVEESDPNFMLVVERTC